MIAVQLDIFACSLFHRGRCGPVDAYAYCNVTPVTVFTCNVCMILYGYGQPRGLVFFRSYKRTHDAPVAHELPERLWPALEAKASEREPECDCCSTNKGNKLVLSRDSMFKCNPKAVVDSNEPPQEQRHGHSCAERETRAD